MLQDGFWEPTTELGELINVNLDLFVNIFLKSKGIQSLGEIYGSLFSTHSHTTNYILKKFWPFVCVCVVQV